MRRSIAWSASIAIALTAAVALAGGDGHPSLVPWKVIEPGAPPVHSPLVLFWVPSSRDELRRSELLTSDELTRFSSQCVAMRIVRLDDFELLRRLGIEADDIPAVVLADQDYDVVSRSSTPSVAEVESMVRDELEELAATAEDELDLARQKAAGGDVDEAILIYRQVWEQRCVCPRQARAAQKALRKLEK